MPRPRLLLLATAAAVLLSACAAFEPAAAVVDGRRIGDARFQRTVAFILADPAFEPEGLPEEDVEQQRRDVTRQLLTFLIQQEVVDERAAERGIDVEDEDIRQSMEQQTEAFGGPEALQERLEASGASEEDLLRVLEAQLVRERVARDVAQEEVTDEVLMEEYEARRAQFTLVNLSHILVRDEALAERLAGQATPQNFGRLARQHSEDPGSAAQGGSLGSTSAGDFVAPFAEAALEIPEGEIGGPVETEFGFHVIMVHDREAPSFEEVRESLLDERTGQAFSEWLEERLRQAEVRVNPRYGAFNPETGQVEERRATTPLPGPQLTP